MSKLLALTLVVSTLLCGCASFETNAYRTLGTVAHSVDAAMNGWGDWVRAGKATPQSEAQVKAAYVKYQAAMAVAKDAVLFIKNSPEDTTEAERALRAVEASSAAIISLIRQLSRP